MLCIVPPKSVLTHAAWKFGQFHRGRTAESEECQTLYHRGRVWFLSTTFFQDS